jgi:hypothetical protein
LSSKIPHLENPVEYTVKDFKLVVRIVNTAQYIFERIGQLKESIVEIIDPIYQDKVDFDDISEVYQVLINQAIDVPISHLNSKIGEYLTFIERTNWGNWAAVEDTSQYTYEVKRLLEGTLPSIIQKLSPEYHGYLYRKIAENFLKRYVMAISRCRTINENGAQQLLMDAQFLEKFLLTTLPRIGAESKKRIPAMYTNYVKGEVGKIVAILKCIGYPPSYIEENFRNLLRNGNSADLQRILEFKNMRRGEQNAIIEAYQKKVPPTQQMKPLLRKDDGPVSFLGNAFSPATFSTPSFGAPTGPGVSVSIGNFKSRFDNISKSFQ